MLLVVRTIPFLLGVVTAGLLLLISVWPSLVLLLSILTVVGVIYGIGHLTGFGKDLEGWWHVAVTPVLFVISTIAFMLFVESQILILVLPIAAGAFTFFFAEHLFRFVHLPSLYQPYALEHTSLVLHVASMFFLSTAFYGLQTFLQIPVWLLAIFFFAFSAMMVYETLWVSKIKDTKAVRVAVIGGLMFTELFVVFSFLPTSFFVNAAASTLVFYVFLGIMRASFLQRLSKVVLKRYAMLGIFMLILLFVTARWV
ncbi:MAG TPA: hypothetical protein QF873_04140 [Patescibacteria group bacterium]|nr:hypothetical protein [Patescibacteria group bacterium]